MEQIGSGIKTGEKLISSSENRLRPVMMASLTTILGMVPLLSDAMFGSMDATIMGGLLSLHVRHAVLRPDPLCQYFSK